MAIPAIPLISTHMVLYRYQTKLAPVYGIYGSLVSFLGPLGSLWFRLCWLFWLRIFLFDRLSLTRSRLRLFFLFCRTLLVIL